MKKGFGETTLEDAEIFDQSNVKNKEITQKNVNKGLSLEDALDSIHGKVLTQDIEAVALESLSKIMTFKHDPEKSIQQNYENILALILEQNTVSRVKARWDNILRTKESSLLKMRDVSQQIKPRRNGG